MCTNLLSFGHTPRPPAFRRRPDRPAWPVWYRVQTGAACPVSGRVCRCVAWPALHLARPALLPVLCSLSGCAGAGVSTSGVYGASRGVGWSTPRVEKIQKRRFSEGVLPTPTPPSQNETHPIVQVSKNSKKYKKTPLEVLNVVYLTEGKGNLKWII